MKIITIQKNKINFTFRIPASWYSVTRSILKRIAPVYLEPLDHESQRVKLLYALAREKAHIFYGIVDDETIEDYEHDLTSLALLLDEVDPLLKLSFSKDIVGNIGIFPLSFKGIGNSMKYLTLDQWIFSGTFAQLYFNTEDPKKKKALLNQLFASLYSPWFCPWRKWMHKPLTIVGHLLSKRLKQAILVNYLGIKAEFAAKNPFLFNHGGKSNPNFEELITDIAGSKFGEVQEVGQKKARLVITYLNKLLKDQSKSKG